MVFASLAAELALVVLDLGLLRRRGVLVAGNDGGRDLAPQSPRLKLLLLVLGQHSLLDDRGAVDAEKDVLVFRVARVQVQLIGPLAAQLVRRVTVALDVGIDGIVRARKVALEKVACGSAHKGPTKKISGPDEPWP